MYRKAFESVSSGGSESSSSSTCKVYLPASESFTLNKVKPIRGPSTIHHRRVELYIIHNSEPSEFPWNSKSNVVLASSSYIRNHDHTDIGKGLSSSQMKERLLKLSVFLTPGCFMMTADIYPD